MKLVLSVSICRQYHPPAVHRSITFYLRGVALGSGHGDLLLVARADFPQADWRICHSGAETRACANKSRYSGLSKFLSRQCLRTSGYYQQTENWRAVWKRQCIKAGVCKARLATRNGHFITRSGFLPTKRLPENQGVLPAYRRYCLHWRENCCAIIAERPSHQWCELVRWTAAASRDGDVGTRYLP